jgi:hypothetical protein
MDHTIPDMPIREAPQGALIAYTVLMVLITLGFLIWWALSERKRGPALLLCALRVDGTVVGQRRASWLSA